MRLPGKPDDKNKIHFLTDFYAKKFDLPLVPFHNSDDNAFLKFYNEEKVTYTGICSIVMKIEKCIIFFI